MVDFPSGLPALAGRTDYIASDSPLKWFQAGGQDQLADNQRNLLKEVGGFAAQGDIQGATSAAFAGGDLKTGIDLSNWDRQKQAGDEARKLKAFEFAQKGAYSADTPEKWAVYHGVMTKLFGNQITAPYSDYTTRGALLDKFAIQKHQAEKQKADAALMQGRAALMQAGPHARLFDEQARALQRKDAMMKQMYEEMGIIPRSPAPSRTPLPPPMRLGGPDMPPSLSRDQGGLAPRGSTPEYVNADGSPVSAQEVDQAGLDRMSDQQLQEWSQRYGLDIRRVAPKQNPWPTPMRLGGPQPDIAPPPGVSLAPPMAPAFQPPASSFDAGTAWAQPTPAYAPPSPPPMPASQPGIVVSDSGTMPIAAPPTPPAAPKPLMQTPQPARNLQEIIARMDAGKRAALGLLLGKEDMAGAAKLIMDTESGKDTADVEDKLRKEHEGLTKTFREAQSSVIEVEQAYKQDSSIGDIAMVYGLVKALDPGSVVRETEYGFITNATGPLGVMLQHVKTLFNAEKRLPAHIREEMLAQSRGSLQSRTQEYDQVTAYVKAMAKARGADPDKAAMASKTARPDTAQLLQEGEAAIAKGIPKETVIKHLKLIGADKQLLQEAREAIQQGKSRDAVIERLRKWGIDPKGLD